MNSLRETLETRRGRLHGGSASGGVRGELAAAGCWEAFAGVDGGEVAVGDTSGTGDATRGLHGGSGGDGERAPMKAASTAVCLRSLYRPLAYIHNLSSAGLPPQ